jgi:hypothetical protein
MGLLDRFSDVVRAEANAAKDAVASVFRRDDKTDSSSIDTMGEQRSGQTHTERAVRSAQSPTIKPGDVPAAMRMLELTGSSTLTLDEVRTQYKRLAEAAYARAHGNGTEQHASLSWALTEALEVLEDHLLPTADTHR